MTTSAPAQPAFVPRMAQRKRRAMWWLLVFQSATLVGIVALGALLYNVINSAFGYTAVEYAIPPETFSLNGHALEQLHPLDLDYILQSHVSENLYRKLQNDKPFDQRTQKEMVDLVMRYVVKPDVIASWTLTDSLLHAERVRAEWQERYPQTDLVFRSWLSPDFLLRPQSSRPEYAGVRTAVLGSLWTIAISILFTFPIGIGAAIYLEEYAGDRWYNRLIQTNINNLAGVPSIIYGILGLAVFVRLLEPLTSGALLGAVPPDGTPNGRTIISAGLTLGLLILPILIINAQEAIRAVPNSLRYASLGLGATRWQTIWHHVLPEALPGILTGAILSVSRAIGETAPLVVIGASTYITFDPDGPFSRFTTLPVQIYQWTSRPQADFRNIAAAAILVLLVLLLSLNATAIVLRNRYSRHG